MESVVQSLGHKRMIFKVDGENPIKAVRDEVKRQSGVEMIPELPPAYESQSNDAIENANQRVQGQFRTARDYLETKIGERIGESSAIVEWLVKYAADVINRFQINDDGKTNYQRWKQKRFVEEPPEF